MLTAKQKLFKRAFDVFFAFIGLVISFLPQVILVVLSSISTKSLGLFSQERVGQFGKIFKLFKIKSMKDVSESESSIAISENKRITNFGKFLRKSKLDELPQLWNVFIGNMSVVGPRPDVKGYADELSEEDKIILSVKPGLTGLATLKFFDEEKLFENQIDIKKYNDEVVWKEKVKLNKEYVKNYSFILDLKIIWKTLLLVIR